MRETGTATLGIKRGARTAQENEDDQDDEDDGADRVRSTFSDRRADCRCAVEHDVVLMPLGRTASRKGSWALTRSTVSNDVGARLTEDDDEDGARAIHVSGGANILRGVDDIGNVGETDCRAVVVPDDEWLVLVGLRDLIVGDDIGGHLIRRTVARAVRASSED